jgi:Activator of Hsp90 ATPase homolog 1-like protein
MVQVHQPFLTFSMSKATIKDFEEESMSMTATLPGIESLTLIITQEIHVKASLQTTFEALLDQLGPENESPEQKMPMILEAWPGGRWYRDLGDDNGHLWGHVQSIKRPSLLEITGPLFMSYAVANNLQYRLSEEPGGTLIRFHHKAFGVIQEEHRRGVNRGWTSMNERIRQRAEAKK